MNALEQKAIVTAIIKIHKAAELVGGVECRINGDNWNVAGVREKASQDCAKANELINVAADWLDALMRSTDETPR